VARSPAQTWPAIPGLEPLRRFPERRQEKTVSRSQRLGNRRELAPHGGPDVAGLAIPLNLG